MPLLPRFVTGRSLLSFKFDREQSADANETHSGTGIALLSYMYMLCVYMNTARPMLIRMVGASRCSHVDREHRASSAGEVMRGKSANVLHMTYVVHTERKRLAGSRWLTSGKPPPVAYVRDYNDHLYRTIRSRPALLLLGAAYNTAGMSCVSTALGARGRQRAKPQGDCRATRVGVRVLLPVGYRCAE